VAPEYHPVTGLVDPSSPSADALRSLRLAIELRTAERRGNVILFTSAEPGEGKSTIAANFALICGFGQSSVLLIDGDFRRPVLHEVFGVSREPGLVDAFVGAKGGQPAFPRVHSVEGLAPVSLVTAGREFPRSGDLVSSKRMTEFIAAASAKFGLVVIDAPPVLLVPDAAGFAADPNVDVVLVVSRSSRKRATMAALRKLELVGANVIGLVANREGSLTTYGY
jgi:capsular exopolysaccharide synthesis family protein